MMNNNKVGFIGLGIMGKPMALNLVKAGYPIAVCRHSGSAAELREAGAELYDDYRALAAASDVVITMLPDSPQVQAVALGPGGVIEGMRGGGLLIDMSTVSPAVSRLVHDAFREKGVAVLDAPVSGGQVGAEAAALSIMVGGAGEAFERALPVLGAMGKNIVHMGEAGAGQVAKACNQLIVGMTIQAVAEAFTLARKSGVDLARLRQVLLGGFAQSRILDLHGQRMIDRDFAPGFKLKLHCKDMGIVLQTGRDISVPLYGAAQVAAHMDAAMASGNGELDHSALALLLESFANFTP